MGFKEWIIPQDKIFFNLLEEQAELVLETAVLFKEMINEYDSFRVQKLHRTFITPIDQEDISKLSSLQDDVLDYIDAVANRIFLFKLEEPDDVIKRFAGIILQQVKEVSGAMKQIRKIRQEEIQEKFKAVHRLENEADDLYDSSMVQLFKGKDPIIILIMKEIYDFLEEITDKCEDVCLAIQDIVIKNA